MIKKIIKKIKSLKKEPLLFSDNRNTNIYNNAIDDVIGLLKAIEKGTEKDFFNSLIPANTGPR